MSAPKKINCWDYKNCGREAEGHAAREQGVCPAYPHSGTRCALMVGTLCWRDSQGRDSSRLRACRKCAFYQSEHYGTQADPPPASAGPAV